MKILIVEDDDRLALALRGVFVPAHAVDMVTTGEDALEAAAETNYDLVLLDLHLPDISGFEVCSELRASKKNMPILVVTANEDSDSIVALLDAGADDYLVKPFRVDELKARVRALTRRQETRTPLPDVLVVGGLSLDRITHIVTHQGVAIPLRNKEFCILELMMLYPNQVHSRASLLNNAWDSAVNGWSNLVDVHIKNLRDRIDKPFGTHYLQTVFGLGYRLNAKGELVD